MAKRPDDPAQLGLFGGEGAGEEAVAPRAGAGPEAPTAPAPPAHTAPGPVPEPLKKSTSTLCSRWNLLMTCASTSPTMPTQSAHRAVSANAAAGSASRVAAS